MLLYLSGCVVCATHAHAGFAHERPMSFSTLHSKISHIGQKAGGTATYYLTNSSCYGRASCQDIPLAGSSADKSSSGMAGVVVCVRVCCRVYRLRILDSLGGHVTYAESPQNPDHFGSILENAAAHNNHLPGLKCVAFVG